MLPKPIVRNPVATVISGDKSSCLHTGQTLRIGRDPQCDLVLDDPRISRIHAELHSTCDGQVTLRDLGSVNGGYLGLQRLPPSLIIASDLTVVLGGLDGVPVRVSPHPVLPAVVPAGSADESGLATVLVRGDPSRPVITIGRAVDNAIVLDDPLVSRHHAQLVPDGDGYRVVNLGSLNGIQLNSLPLPPDALFGPGDRLGVGRTTLGIVDGYIVADTNQHAALVANHLTFSLRTGRTLLKDVNFIVAPGSLVAVVGPSGAGKSTLLRAITGAQPATSGQVLYQGQDLYQNFARLRQVIGLVPQDDVVHRQLTVRQALDYAAELRLPADYDHTMRTAEVDRVIHDLGLGEHQNTPIARLSGGQRKRTSVAMELLTQPHLLLLDEPTSGLDPGLDLDVMTLLRAQADSGRTVLVITHSTENLDLCDQVLVLAPGGMVAYYGPPRGILPHFAMSSHPEVFKSLADDPASHARRWSITHPSDPDIVVPDPIELDSTPPKQRATRQWRTLIRRQLRIIVSDRTYALSTLLLPLIIAAMALVIPGTTGFGRPPLDKPGEPSQLLVIITVGAAFMGMSSSIRELIAERAIFLRERAVGLSPLIYLLAKVYVLLGLAALQTALLIGLVALGKPGPDGAVWASSGWLELWLAAFATAFSSALLGLLLSASVGTGEQTMPALVITVMAQLVFCGGLITITDRGVLEWIAAVFPSRWGFAQSAATIDLSVINPTIEADSLWEHTLDAWLHASAAQGIIAVFCLVVTAIALTRQSSTR